MEIYPDPVHVALLSIPFLVTVVSLYLILWQPLLEWMGEREHKIESALLEAEEFDEAADEQLSRIESRLAEAHASAGKVRAEARARAMAREAEIAGAARSTAESEIADALGRIKEEQDTARTALQATAQELSTTIAARILGREVT